jgi:hypothetical protein
MKGRSTYKASGISLCLGATPAPGAWGGSCARKAKECGRCAPCQQRAQLHAHSPVAAPDAGARWPAETPPPERAPPPHHRPPAARALTPGAAPPGAQRTTAQNLRRGQRPRAWQSAAGPTAPGSCSAAVCLRKQEGSSQGRGGLPRPQCGRRPCAPVSSSLERHLKCAISRASLQPAFFSLRRACPHTLKTGDVCFSAAARSPPVPLIYNHVAPSQPVTAVGQAPHVSGAASQGCCLHQPALAEAWPVILAHEALIRCEAHVKALALLAPGGSHVLLPQLLPLGSSPVVHQQLHSACRRSMCGAWPARNIVCC